MTRMSKKGQNYTQSWSVMKIYNINMGFVKWVRAAAHKCCILNILWLNMEKETLKHSILLSPNAWIHLFTHLLKWLSNHTLLCEYHFIISCCEESKNSIINPLPGLQIHTDTQRKISGLPSAPHSKLSSVAWIIQSLSHGLNNRWPVGFSPRKRAPKHELVG